MRTSTVLNKIMYPQRWSISITVYDMKGHAREKVPILCIRYSQWVSGVCLSLILSKECGAWRSISLDMMVNFSLFQLPVK